MKIFKIIIIITAIIILLAVTIFTIAIYFNNSEKTVNVYYFKNVSYKVIYKGDQGALGIGYVEIYENSKDTNGNVKSNKILSEDGINASIIQKEDSTFFYIWGSDDKIFSLYKGKLTRVKLNLYEFEELTIDDEHIKLSFNNVFILNENIYFRAIDTCYIDTNRNKPKIIIKSNGKIYNSNSNVFRSISKLDSINQIINSIIVQYHGFEEIIFSKNEIIVRFKNGYLKQYKTTYIQSAMIVNIFQEPAIEIIFNDTSTVYSNTDKFKNSEEIRKIVMELNKRIKINNNSSKSKAKDIKHKNKLIENVYFQSWPNRIFSFGQGNANPSVVNPMSLRKASIKGAKLNVWHSIIKSTFNLMINKTKIINDLFIIPEGKYLKENILNYLRNCIIYDDIKYYNNGNVKINGFINTDSIKTLVNEYLKEGKP
jgi:hypothetical protein